MRYAILIKRARWITLAILSFVRSPAQCAAEPVITWNPDRGQAVLKNGRLELVIETNSGLNAGLLRDTKSGRLYADRDYSWSEGGFPKLLKPPVISQHGYAIKFEGQLGFLTVEQCFTLPTNQPGVLIEQITIRNLTSNSVSAAGFRCGFAKHLRTGEAWSDESVEMHLCPVPYRRDTDGQLKDLPLKEIALRGSQYQGWAEPVHNTPISGAEGWVWSRGGTTLLVAKYNPDAMEWSLIEPVKRGAETVARFGGAGQWKHGHPEGASKLAPGESFRFGETRFEFMDGDWKPAWYSYRNYIDSKGCRAPKGYNPPVHWNELYDNGYFPEVVQIVFKPDFEAKNEKLLKELYTLDLMKAEAAKAKELGCEALYLDPGWDTGPSHHIWDAKRLGSMASFVDTLRDTYGLKLSLWIALGGVPPSYADPKACPVEARVVNEAGQQTEVHCVSSPAFFETKEKRLLELCREGVTFLMFDSTQYSGPCHDKTHRHQLPSTREEHARSLIQLAQRIKSQYPKTLIEMHDPITGPAALHYTPTYFGYARSNSFDCLWGHEFMWNSMDDLVSGRAISLYYFNLAYSIPLYLHVNLKQDNTNALMFWWYASTCRHLGVGGKPEAEVWEACKRAMREYMALKPFYTQGVFYGIEETIHAHTLPASGKSVLNVFNLENKPVQRAVRFRLAEIGLSSGAVEIQGGSFHQQDDEVTLNLAIPARGHLLLQIDGRRQQDGR